MTEDTDGAIEKAWDDIEAAWFDAEFAALTAAEWPDEPPKPPVRSRPLRSRWWPERPVDGLALQHQDRPGEPLSSSLYSYQRSPPSR